MFDAIRCSIFHQLQVGSINRTTFIVLTDGIDTSSECSLNPLINLIKDLRTVKIIFVAIKLDNVDNLHKIGQTINLFDFEHKFTRIRNDILALEASKNIKL